MKHLIGENGTRKDNILLKKRGFFACHPDDFEKYFTPICEDIFEVSDCSIWYDQENKNDWQIQDAEKVISVMDLIIIPVTSNFAYKENSVRDIILPYALEHRIPVLPIIEETGVQEDIKDVFGANQIWDPNQPKYYENEILYKQELSDLLYSLLFGRYHISKSDERENKENDDTANWIKEDIQRLTTNCENEPSDGNKEKLFNNLLWLGDFYLKEGKNLNAIEYYMQIWNLMKNLLEGTDRQKWIWQKGDAYIRQGVICEKKGDLKSAEEWYKAGIDIEEEESSNTFDSDYEYKLLNIYDHLGDNLLQRKDYDNAAIVLKRRLEIAKKSDVHYNIPTAHRNVASCLEKLTRVYMKRKSIEEAERYMKTAFEIRSELYKKYSNAYFYQDLCRCYMLYAELEALEGGVQKNYYLKGLTIAENLYEEEKDSQWLNLSMQTYDRIKDIYESDNKSAEIFKYYNKIIEWSCRANFDLAGIYESERKKETAQDIYNRLIERIKNLFDEDERNYSYNLRMLLIKCYRKIAKKSRQSQELLNECIDQALDLLNEYKQRETKIELALLCRDMGQELIHGKNISDGRLHYEEAVKLIEEIINDDFSIDCQYILAIIYRDYAESLIGMQHRVVLDTYRKNIVNEACEYFRRALKTIEKISPDDKLMFNVCLEGDIYIGISRCYKEIFKHKEEIEFYKKGAQLYLKRYRTLGTLNSLKQTAKCYDYLVQHHTYMDEDEAKGNFDIFMKFNWKLVKMGDKEAQHNLSQAYKKFYKWAENRGEEEKIEILRGKYGKAPADCIYWK